MKFNEEILGTDFRAAIVPKRLSLAPAIRRTADWLVNDLPAYAFMVLFGSVIAQIFFRYVLNDPLAWTSEMAAIAFIFVVFWINGVCLPLRKHVIFDILYQSLGDNKKRVFGVTINSTFLILFIWMIPYTIEYFDFLRMVSEPTPSLEIGYDIIFFPYFIFAVAFPMRLLISVLRLLSSKWRNYI